MKIEWKSFGLGMIIMSVGLGIQSLNKIEPRHLCDPSEWFNFIFSFPILVIISIWIIPFIINKFRNHDKSEKANDNGHGAERTKPKRWEVSY